MRTGGGSIELDDVDYACTADRVSEAGYWVGTDGRRSRECNPWVRPPSDAPPARGRCTCERRYRLRRQQALEVTQLREIARQPVLAEGEASPYVGHMLGGDGHLAASRIAAAVSITGIVSLVVSGSSSPGQAVVPDVVEMPVHLAYDAVHEAGFAVQIDEPVELDSYVSDQSRAAGTTGHAGTPVVLTFVGSRLLEPALSIRLVVRLQLRSGRE
jgi:hypothetical protein